MSLVIDEHGKAAQQAAEDAVELMMRNVKRFTRVVEAAYWREMWKQAEAYRLSCCALAEAELGIKTQA